MERKSKLILTGTGAVFFGMGLAGIAINQESNQPQTPFLELPGDRTLLPTPTNLESETEFVIPTRVSSFKEFPNLTPTFVSSPTPEIPFGEHPCGLPLEVPFTLGVRFKDQIREDGKLLFDEFGIPHRHLGVDFWGVKEGDKVLNICDGELVFAGPVEKGEGNNLGNIVVIKDILSGDHLIYAHLSQFMQKTPGSKILAGEEIGEVGHTGGWDLDHLHLQIFTRYGWFLIKDSTIRYYDGDYSKTAKLFSPETINDEGAAKRLVDPLVFIFEGTGVKLW